jgi:uncharacterized protein with HEPN domain
VRLFLPFRDTQTHLRDIEESIDHINDFLGDMDFDTYRNDLKTKSAVERQLQILTEAAIRLGEVDGPKVLGPEWKGYCKMGNIIRHAYHKVDDTIIWDTVKKELPGAQGCRTKSIDSASRKSEWFDSGIAFAACSRGRTVAGRGRPHGSSSCRA